MDPEVAKAYAKVQNGSDVRGIAIDGAPPQGALGAAGRWQAMTAHAGSCFPLLTHSRVHTSGRAGGWDRRC